MELKRPNIVAMDKLEEVIDTISLLEDKIKELNEKLNDTVHKITLECDNEQSKIEALRYIYWSIPEVKSATIANILNVKSYNTVTKILGSASVDILCERCGKSLTYKSRTTLKDGLKRIKHWCDHNAKEYNIVCNVCMDEIYNELSHSKLKEQEENEGRRKELGKMRYGEYLQTPEWKGLRERKLRSAEYKCQTCNAYGKQLHVHHRTYERRGYERLQDLIVLCKDCHELFHFNERDES